MKKMNMNIQKQNILEISWNKHNQLKECLIVKQLARMFKIALQYMEDKEKWASKS